MNKFLPTLFTCFLIVFFVAGSMAQPAITPETALRSYLNNKDTVYHWELKDSFNVGTVKAYDLLLTSQKWREFTWTHQLTVFIPEHVTHDDALLFITGGSDKDGLPNWNGPSDELYKGVGTMASTNSAVTAVLRQTPNQPLYGTLTEDALISYTLHNFTKDGDYTWPLLFPMVKSAVRAMDAVQSFTSGKAHKKINGFVVSGASKRGWTTWLTGANDKRVVAIAPMVIDVLNMPVSLQYQITTWKEYSIQIEDYVKLGITEEVATPTGSSLTKMIDPYSYRKTLTMPKLIMMGTNDPYWVIDNIKNYIDSIPGNNFINYVPNVPHNLGDFKQATDELSDFFGITINHLKYPVCNWKTSVSNNDALVNISATADKLVDVIVWSASSADLDFRNETWSSKSLGISNKSAVSVKQAFPQKGYGAFYVDLKYKDNTGGTFLVSTRVFVTDTKKIL